MPFRVSRSLSGSRLNSPREYRLASWTAIGGTSVKGGLILGITKKFENLRSFPLFPKVFRTSFNPECKKSAAEHKRTLVIAMDFTTTVAEESKRNGQTKN